MSRLHIATRGIGSWRERLACPDRQWKRGFSAFETAVAWEHASKNRESGLPEPIERVFQESGYDGPILLFAVAEHQVKLRGGNASSQSDVWGVVQTSTGMVSLSVEAKAQESFGDGTLEQWLAAGKTERSHANRKVRWAYIQDHLPQIVQDCYCGVAYQLLHRCAAGLIEAKRLRLDHAAFIVQAFDSPRERFDEFQHFCAVIGIAARPQSLQRVGRVADIQLSVGWVDCPIATDEQVAATA